MAGQPPVAYSYDNADRPTAITQGAMSVTVAYDTINRPTSMTLPSGVTLEYGYDAASQLTGIVYKQAANLLGTLTYGYDAAGQRTAMGGAFARTGLPAPMSGAAYNAANQLTQRGATSFTYDANGNLTGGSTGPRPGSCTTGPTRCRS